MNIHTSWSLISQKSLFYLQAIEHTHKLKPDFSKIVILSASNRTYTQVEARFLKNRYFICKQLNIHTSWSLISQKSLFYLQAIEHTHKLKPDFSKIIILSASNWTYHTSWNKISQKSLFYSASNWTYTQVEARFLKNRYFICKQLNIHTWVEARFLKNHYFICKQLNIHTCWSQISQKSLFYLQAIEHTHKLKPDFSKIIILSTSNWTYTQVEAWFLKYHYFICRQLKIHTSWKPDFSKIVILSASNWTYTQVEARFLKNRYFICKQLNIHTSWSLISQKSLFYLQAIEHTHKLKPDFSKIVILSASNWTYTQVEAWFLKNRYFTCKQLNIHTSWSQISQKSLFYLQAIEHTHKLKPDFSKIVILSASNWTYTQVEARFLKNRYFICKQLNIHTSWSQISQKSLFYLHAIEHTHKLKPDFSKIVILSASNWTYTQVEARFLKNRYFICKQLNIHTSWSQISQKSLFYLQAIEHTHKLKPDFSKIIILSARNWTYTQVEARFLKNHYFICKQLNIHTSWSQISQKSLFYLQAIEHTHKLKPDFSKIVILSASNWTYTQVEARFLKNHYFICKQLNIHTSWSQISQNHYFICKQLNIHTSWSQISQKSLFYLQAIEHTHKLKMISQKSLFYLQAIEHTHKLKPDFSKIVILSASNWTYTQVEARFLKNRYFICKQLNIHTSWSQISQKSLFYLQAIEHTHKLKPDFSKIVILSASNWTYTQVEARFLKNRYFICKQLNIHTSWSQISQKSLFYLQVIEHTHKLKPDFSKIVILSVKQLNIHTSWSQISQNRYFICKQLNIHTSWSLISQKSLFYLQAIEHTHKLKPDFSKIVIFSASNWTYTQVEARFLKNCYFICKQLNIHTSWSLISQKSSFYLQAIEHTHKLKPDFSKIVILSASNWTYTQVEAWFLKNRYFICKQLNIHTSWSQISQKSLFYLQAIEHTHKLKPDFSKIVILSGSNWTYTQVEAQKSLFYLQAIEHTHKLKPDFSKIFILSASNWTYTQVEARFLKNLYFICKQLNIHTKLKPDFSKIVILSASNWTYTHVEARFLKNRYFICKQLNIHTSWSQISQKSLFYLQAIEHTHKLKPDFSKIVILFCKQLNIHTSWSKISSKSLFYLHAIEHTHKLKPDFSKFFILSACNWTYTQVEARFLKNRYFICKQLNIHTSWSLISQKSLFYLQAIEHTHKLKPDFSKIIILSASNRTYTQVEARFLKNRYFICKQLNIHTSWSQISQKSLFYLQAIEHTHKLKQNFSKIVILSASNWTYTQVEARFLKNRYFICKQLNIHTSWSQISQKSLFYLQAIEHTHKLKPDFSKIVILSASNWTYTQVEARFLKNRYFISKQLNIHTSWRLISQKSLFYLQAIEHTHKLKPNFSKSVIFSASNWTYTQVEARFLKNCYFICKQLNIHTSWSQISQKSLFYLQAIEHTHKLKPDFSKIIILSACNWTYTQVEAWFLKNRYFICKQLNIHTSWSQISQKSLFYLQAIEHTHKLKPDFSKIIILSASNWTYTQVEAWFLKNHYFICKQLNIHTSWSQISQKLLFYLQAIEHTHKFWSLISQKSLILSASNWTYTQVEARFLKNHYFICKQLNIHTCWSQISQKSLFYLQAIEHTHMLKPDFSKIIILSASNWTYTHVEAWFLKNRYFICKQLNIHTSWSQISQKFIILSESNWTYTQVEARFLKNRYFICKQLNIHTSWSQISQKSLFYLQAIEHTHKLKPDFSKIIILSASNWTYTQVEARFLKNRYFICKQLNIHTSWSLISQKSLFYLQAIEHTHKLKPDFSKIIILSASNWTYTQVEAWFLKKSLFYLQVNWTYTQVEARFLKNRYFICK